MTGRLELPSSNALPELHRILRNFNRRMESMEASQNGNGTAASTAKATTGSTSSSSGSSSGSGSSSTTSTTTDSTSSLVVGFLRFMGLQMDQTDGLVAVDADGYALFQEAEIPFSVAGMTALEVSVPVSNGTWAWNLPAGFDPDTTFVNFTGTISAPVTVYTNLAGKSVIIRNGATMPTDVSVASLRIALGGQTPADSGILIPNNGLVWVRTNAAGTALELVPSYA